MTEDFNSLSALAKEAESKNTTISKITTEIECTNLKKTEEELRLNMKKNLSVMEKSIESGLLETASPSGLSGGMSKKLADYESPLLGNIAHTATIYALAVAEHNACMGRIVASPTAGSCGILPGALFALKKHLNITEEKLIDALINASAVGMVIAKRATLSGAEGGCMAECGSAGAMAASAVCEIMGGTPRMCLHAAAIALKAVMGLVCDPVAGLVEVPCIKRNGIGAVNALTAAEMALSGIESAIPADEVIDAMKTVGSLMPCSLKETALGGIAITETAKKIEKEFKIKEVPYEEI
ncbi:MAG: L-serine ammonia-lyase, iron-sulfur-dependent, subunit alpha [Clostridia bacterium]|nr:L-serine ammonia-lyase, iron-sulfur-dependent, subunit alpha [Clostridia bacterium]